jgi:hypothetical protein
VIGIACGKNWIHAGSFEAPLEALSLAAGLVENVVDIALVFIVGNAQSSAIHRMQFARAVSQD